MDKQQAIQTETETLISKLGIQASVSVSKDQDMYLVAIATETDAPFLIGKYGDTLHSLQRIIEAMLFKQFSENTTIVVNVNDYRERQKERLQKIADNVAQRVVSSGRESSLSSFSAYERRIIHEHIGANYPDLTSYSEGEGGERRLIIAPKTKTE